MGACDFRCRESGASAKQAFAKAVTRARYDHGHAGYSGTIAEKSSFVEIPVPAGLDPAQYADQLLVDGDARVDDKWGPAGCIKVGDREWMFFGWASS